MFTTLVLAAFLSGYSTIAQTLIVGAVAFFYTPFLLRGRLDRLGWYASLFCAYWLISALVAASLPPLAELSTWLSLDGRILVALMPFILFGMSKPTARDMRFFVGMLSALVWTGVLLYVVALAGFPGTENVVRRYNFFGLTSSHHATGYIYGTALIILIPVALRRMRIYWPVTTLACAGLMLASGSRTTVLGLLIVSLWYLWRYAHGSKRLRFVVSLAIVLGLIAIASPQVSETIGFVASDNFDDRAVPLVKTSLERQEPGGVAIGQTESAGEANALKRFPVWGRALGRWLNSPLVGIGSGRFNDQYAVYAGVPGIAHVVVSGVDGSGTAHNQYLQTLAESGVVGLGLLLLPFLAAGRLPPLRNSGSDRTAALLLAFMLGTALTGSTLESPGLTFIAVSYLMLLVRHKRVSGEMPE